MPIAPFDAFMAAVLAVLVTLISRLHSPRWKSFIYSFPIPFTLAFIVSGIPVNAGHVAGLLLNHFFLWGVYSLHAIVGLNIILADILMVSLYAVVSAGLMRVIPLHELWLFLALLAVGLAYSALSFRFPPREEPGHTSPMPVWQKATLVFLLACTLFTLKGFFLAAVTTFPYLGSFTVIECRKSLYSLGRRFGHLSSAFLALILVLWILQDRMPMGLALPISWVPALVILGTCQFRELEVSRANAACDARCSRT